MRERERVNNDECIQYSIPKHAIAVTRSFKHAQEKIIDITEMGRKKSLPFLEKRIG